MAEQDICPHLDSIGEVTTEDLLQKSKVSFHSFTVNCMQPHVKDALCRLLAVCAVASSPLKSIIGVMINPLCTMGALEAHIWFYILLCLL